MCPRAFRAAVVAWGKASVISMALTLLEKLGTLPLRCLPQPTVDGQWVCVRDRRVWREPSGAVNVVLTRGVRGGS